MLILNQLTANFTYKLNCTHIQKHVLAYSFCRKIRDQLFNFFTLVFQILSLDLAFPHSRTPHIGQLLSYTSCPQMKFSYHVTH